MKNFGVLYFLEKHLENIGKMVPLSEKNIKILDLPVDVLVLHGKSTLSTPTFSEERSQRSNYIDISWKTARMISDYGSEHRVLISNSPVSRQGTQLIIP